MDRGRGDPPVGLVVSLAECMPDALAADPKVDIRLQESGTRPDDLRTRQLRGQAGHPGGSPPSPASTEADLGQSLERDHEAPSGQERLVEVHQVMCCPKQIGAEDVGVDDDRRRARPHRLPGDRVEKLRFFPVAEIVEHGLGRRRPRLGSPQLLLDVQLEVIAG